MPDTFFDAVQRLKAHLAPIVDLRHAAAVLGWDQQTHMPPGGGQARAEQLATLSRTIHEMFTAPRTRELLEAAEAVLDRLDPDADEAALVRMTRRDFDQASKLPSEFVAERRRASSLSVEVWRKARPADDFAAFRPHLQQMVDYARRTADYLGYTDHPYDALLDLYEPLMTSPEVADLFVRLREGTVPLVRAIAERGQVVDDGVVHREYDEAKQEAFALAVTQAFGYDLTRGRLDRAPHPFATSFSRDDVRITTRFDRHFFNPAVFAIFHEAGHAMYQQGIAPPWSARRWRAGPAWVCTSRSRGCGRTWSAGAAPSGGTTSRSSGRCSRSNWPTWTRRCSTGRSTKWNRASSGSKPTR